MRNLHEIRKRLKKRQKPEEPWPARVGDASGTIEVPGNPGLWYVRPEGSDLPVIVQRGSAPKIRDYPVWVGSDTHKKRVKRILGVNATAISAGTGAGGNSPTPLEPHASSHFETGWDVVYVTTAQVVDALAYISGGMNVTVNPGWAIIGGKPRRIAGATVDMSSHVPASGARWALIRVDEAGAISVQDGNTVASLADLTGADMPQVAVGYAALAAVRLYEGQTALSNVTEERDLIDLRMSPGDGSGGGLSYAIGLYDEASLKGVYEASYAGLLAALGEALAGDTVMLPPGDYTGNLNIPDGVAVVGQARDTTRLLGTVTTIGDAIIQNLRIEKVTPDTQNEKALVVNGINKTVSLVGVSIIASVPQSGTCRAISIDADQAVVQARQCYIAGTYNQSTLVYFGGVGQAARLRFCYLDGNNPTNDATRLYTYACQFHAEAASYGTPEVGDRAAYNHNHDAAYLKRSGGDFTTFPDIYNLYAGDKFLIEKASDASKAKVTADIIADYWFNYYYTTFLRSEGGAFTQFTQKTAPDSADRLLLEDNADFYNKKYSTLGNIKSSLETGFNADLLDGQHGSYYTPELPSWSWASRLRAGYTPSDDFNSAPTYNWAGSPFVTPSYYTTADSHLKFGQTAGKMMFILPSVGTQLYARMDSNASAVGSYWGIRFDDGTDNNYVEAVIYVAQTAPILYDLRIQWRTGGGAVNSSTSVQNMNLLYPLIIHLYRDGTSWSSWAGRITDRFVWSYVGHVGVSTTTQTWTPTRFSFILNISQTWAIVAIDWYRLVP